MCQYRVIGVISSCDEYASVVWLVYHYCVRIAWIVCIYCMCGYYVSIVPLLCD